MEQQENNTFQYIENQESTPIQQEISTITNSTVPTEEKQITEDFVTGLPSWDLEPPYEVIRRVTRQ